MIHLFLLLGLLFAGDAFADADCGSTNPASPCTGTSHTHNVDGVTFTWAYTCSGGACQHGRFWDGTTWVRHASGGSVVFSSVTPDGATDGLEKNPATGANATSFTQGLYTLTGGDATYSAALDLSTQLPYSAAADNGSYVKAQAYSGTTCDRGAAGDNCLNAYDVTTVVVDVPNDGANGGNTFRPGMAGGTKLFVTLSDIDLTLLPRMSAITAGTYSTILNRWRDPMVEYFQGKNGDLGQRWVPVTNGLNSYSAYRGEQNIQDLFGVFSSDALTADKSNAVYAMLQYGMDIYAGFTQGVEWVTGAGQGQGKWHPMVLFATLYNGASESTVKSTVASAATGASATGNGSNVKFTELHQIRPNIYGLPIWGGHPGSATVSDGCSGGSYNSTGTYWSNYSIGVLRNSTATGNRACGDVYDIIDGIAHQPGAVYSSCCSSGVYVSIGLAMKIWPEFRIAANYPTFLNFVERIQNGAGWWAPTSDLVAIADPRETTTCNPYTTAQTSSTGCLYFGNTWGHDTINNDGTYVSVAEATARGHPSPGPRFPSYHLAGRPTNLGHCTPGCTMWDTLVPRTGNEVAALGTITNDD